MKTLIAGLALVIAALAAGAAQAQDIKIALIYSKTGPLEAYAKQTETGFMLGLEYLTGGTMTVGGRKIVVLLKDDQGKPDIAKSLLEQAYADDKVDLAIGTTASGSALAMLPVAEDAGRVLIVEPAVADSITGDKWNRFIFRTARNSTQDALATAVTLGSLRFGRHAGAGLRVRSRRRGGAQGCARRDQEQGEDRIRGIRAAEHDRFHRVGAAPVRRAQGAGRGER